MQTIFTTHAIMDEIATGDGIGLNEVCALMPSRKPGKRIHFSAAWRWATKGIKTTDGRIVKLETARVAGRLVTTRSALARFLAAQQSGIEQSATAPPRSAIRRRRDSERAGERLKKVGI